MPDTRNGTPPHTRPVPLFRRPVVLQNADDQVYEALRDEIMNGLAPGTVLRLADVAGRLGVSTMPVRTALVRLAAEGLVVQLPRRGGAVVAPMEHTGQRRARHAPCRRPGGCAG